MLSSILAAIILWNPLLVGYIAPSFNYGLIQEKQAIVLYYTTYCPYSQKVLRYLQQIHKTVPMINVENNPQAKEALLKAGGKLQVPCLIVNGRAIYESDDIIEWLSEHQGELASDGQRTSLARE